MCESGLGRPWAYPLRQAEGLLTNRTRPPPHHPGQRQAPRSPPPPLTMYRQPTRFPVPLHTRTFGRPTMPIFRLFLTRPNRAAPLVEASSSAFLGGIAPLLPPPTQNAWICRRLEQQAGGRGGQADCRQERQAKSRIVAAPITLVSGWVGICTAAHVLLGGTQPEWDVHAIKGCTSRIPKSIRSWVYTACGMAWGNGVSYLVLFQQPWQPRLICAVKRQRTEPLRPRRPLPRLVKRKP